MEKIKMPLKKKTTRNNLSVHLQEEESENEQSHLRVKVYLIAVPNKSYRKNNNMKAENKKLTKNNLKRH